MASRIVCLLVFVLANLSAAYPAASEELPKGMVAVHYAFKLGQWPPVTGESFCYAGKDCVLGLESDPVRITLLLALGDAMDRLSIACPKWENDCSFGLERSQIDFVNEDGFQSFRIAEGRGRGAQMIWCSAIMKP